MQQMLCDHLALLLHQLCGHRVDQIERNREHGEGTIDAQRQPPDQLFVFAMSKILEHQKANGQAGQSAGQMRYIRDLRTLGKGGRGSAIEVLRVDGIAQIAGDCGREEQTQSKANNVS